jgi:hypothetical protein
MMLLGEIFGMKLSAASDILLGRSTSLARRNDTRALSIITSQILSGHKYAFCVGAGVILSAGDSNALQALTARWINVICNHTRKKPPVK